MNSRRKICFVVTARPSYSRIRAALRAAHEHSELELQLVVAASALLARYGSAADVIEAACPGHLSNPSARGKSNAGGPARIKPEMP